MSRLMKSKTRNKKFWMREQAGYTLLETTVVVALMIAITSSGLGWLQYSQQLERGESVADIYLEINKAVQNYQTVHYDELVAVPADCSKSTVRDTDGVVAGVVLPVALAGCQKTYRRADDGANYVVENILQPTLSDLKALGYLPSTAPNHLPLPASLRVVGQVDPAPAAPSLMPATFAVRIEQICTGAKLDEVNCPRKDLQGLLYNLQPYDVENTVGVFFSGSLALQTAFSKLQAQGVLSDKTEKGALLGWQGSFSVRNPLQDSEGVGSPNVLGIRSGYGSAGLMHMMRADGSVKPTGDWDFNKQSLRNVASLQATGVEADRVTVGGAVQSGSIDVRGGSLTVQAAGSGTQIELRADGSVTAKSASVSGRLESASAQITQGLTAAEATVTGALNAGQAFVSDKLYLGPLKVLGAACHPGSETLARQSGANYSAGEGILQCNAATNKWDALRGAQGPQGAQGQSPPLEVVQRTTSSNVTNLKTGLLCKDYERPWLSRMELSITHRWENPAFAAFCIDEQWQLSASHPTADLYLTWNFLKKTRWLSIFTFTTFDLNDGDHGRTSPFSCDAFLRPWVSVFYGHVLDKREGYSWLTDCNSSNIYTGHWRVIARAQNTEVGQVDWNFLAKGHGLKSVDFTLNGTADGRYRSTGLSCDEWLPPWVANLWLTEIGTWEPPLFNARCADGKWEFMYSLVYNHSKLDVRLIFLKKN